MARHRVGRARCGHRRGVLRDGLFHRRAPPGAGSESGSSEIAQTAQAVSHHPSPRVRRPASSGGEDAGPRRDERSALHRRRAGRSRPAPGGSGRCRAGGRPRPRPGRGCSGAARMNAPCWAWLQSSGPGVVLPDVERRVADAADRPPGQAAEVDDQVGRHVADRPVDLLRLEDERAERPALGVGRGLEPGLELVAEPLVVGRLDRAVGLAPLHVEEDAGVVAPLAPDAGLVPVDVELGERRDLLGVPVQDQQALADEPLVDAEAAVEPPRAVVGDDQDDRVVVEQLQEAADLLVEVAVVVADRRRGRGCRARAGRAAGRGTSRSRGGCGRGRSRRTGSSPTRRS